MKQRIVIKKVQFRYHQLYSSIVQENIYDNVCNYYKRNFQQQYTTTTTHGKTNTASKTTTTTTTRTTTTTSTIHDNWWLMSSNCQRCSINSRNNYYNINNKQTRRKFTTTTTNDETIHNNNNSDKIDNSTYIKNNNNNSSSSTNIRYLDLRGCGLSILERLCLEECLYQLDINNHWIIVGYHDVITHKYFKEKLNNNSSTSSTTNSNSNHSIKPISINTYPAIKNTKTTSTIDIEQIDNDIDIDNNNNNETNTNVAIILGIGGKVHDLLNVSNVQKDTVLCIKRFTGGGTVVLDNDCIWTTIIGRRSIENEQNTTGSSTSNSNTGSNNPKEQHVYNEQQHTQSTTIFNTIQEFFPRPIMKWTVDTIYNKVFIKLQQKQNEQQQKKQQQTKQQPPPTPLRTLMPGYTDTTNYNTLNKIIPRKTLVMDTKSCSYDNTGHVITIPSSTVLDNSEHIELLSSLSSSSSSSTSSSPIFTLLENDYVMTWNTNNTNLNLNETTPIGNIDDTNNTTNNNIIKKIGGNAQAIGKNGFIHHTSFLWDYDMYNMKHYLQIPTKHPTYRNNRVHDTFVCSIQSIYPNLHKSNFIQCIQEVCYELFITNTTIKHVNTVPSKQSSSSSSTSTTTKSTLSSSLPSEPNFKHVTINETMAIVNTITNGIGLQGWYEQKSRNKILTDLSK